MQTAPSTFTLTIIYFKNCLTLVRVRPYSVRHIAKTKNSRADSDRSLLHFCLLLYVKVAMSQDFLAYFHEYVPTWAPDQQAKMILLKDSFLWRYS